MSQTFVRIKRLYPTDSPIRLMTLFQDIMSIWKIEVRRSRHGYRSVAIVHLSEADAEKIVERMKSGKYRRRING
jgi:hypothetical protein